MAEFDLHSCDSDEIRERLRLSMKIVEKSPVILFRRMPEPEPRLVYVSENINRIGYSADDFIEERIKFPDIVHRRDQERLREEIEDYARRDLSDYTQVYRIVTRDGETRWVEDTTTTERDANGKITHYQGIVVDITERKLAEEKLSRSEAKFRRILATAAEGFVLLDDKMRIVDVNEAYCRMLGYDRVELMGMSPHQLATKAFKRFLEANAERLLNTKHRTFEGSYHAKDGHLVPVLIHGNTLYDDDGRQLGFVDFVTDLTEQKRSLLLAGEVQKNLLPKHPPRVPGLDIAGRSIPCDEIGGDYYDFLTRKAASSADNDLVAVTVADIAGHGVDSALLMATARSAIRERFASPGSLNEVVGDLNRSLLDDFSTTDRFMTLFALQIDRRDGHMCWVRAGHDPALVYYPADDKFDTLGGTGLPLGISGRGVFSESKSRRLPAGTIIAVGTDGIWEARGPEGEMFGKERFKQIIRKESAHSAHDILDRVYSALYRFGSGYKPEDDITLVIIKIEPMNT
ncbi:MAG: SpoIIE family protein phosphatase [Deltaproteobacteria bacterium]|jgi:phosphoserine phosphatase RsbU/P|nr:SpoIIE family protein phosphatase [Deltaproteobacteria bacterium]